MIKKWKIIQMNPEEYLLFLDSNTIKKIKGKHAPHIVAVLTLLQEEKDLAQLFTEEGIPFLEQNKMEDSIAWLTVNQFITPASEDIAPINLTLIGEFGSNLTLLTTFIAGLPQSIQVSKVCNLSDVMGEKLEVEKGNTTDLILLLGPYFYQADTIQKISLLQKASTTDFLFVEMYENGVLLGPLMNSSKETVCLACIEKRKIFNTTQPHLLLDHIWHMERIKDYPISVFEIGSFPINTAFIYNELHKIAVYKNKSLYNRALFIDFNRYNNQYFNVLKAPGCEFCNPISIYNPLC